MTVHNCDFIRDPDFIRAYRAGENLNSWFGGKVEWRMHTLFWAAVRAMSLDGDLVECGVHRGGFSRAIAEFVDIKSRPDKTFYLLDNFEGLSEEQVSDEEKRNGILDYPYSGNYDLVVRNICRVPECCCRQGQYSGHASTGEKRKGKLFIYRPELCARDRGGRVFLGQTRYGRGRRAR